MRQYLSTHRWITFRVDLSRAGAKLWMLLGEAQSKCFHISRVPLLPAVSEQLHNLAFARGVLATTAIEGNTLTEAEVQQRISGTLSLPPSREYLGLEVDNVVRAYNEVMRDLLRQPSSSVSVTQIKRFNGMILEGLPLPDEVIPGAIRTHSVGVGQYRGAPAEDCEFLLEKLCEMLNGIHAPDPADRMAYGILKAIVAHLYLAWIHPFGDGNGRTARLLELQLLLAAGLPTPTAHLLSNHYNLTRMEYYRQLERSSRDEDGLLSFVQYALQGLVDGLRGHIEQIQEQQLRVHLINHIHQAFHGKDRITDVRRRWLALDLLDSATPVMLPDLRRHTPRLAEAYAGKTEITIRRDIAALEKLSLVMREGSGYRIRHELMLGYLPQAVSAGDLR